MKSNFLRIQADCGLRIVDCGLCFEMKSSFPRILAAVMVLFCLFASVLAGYRGEPDSKMVGKCQLRRPVALALSGDGKSLYVANRDSGSISVIDTGELRKISETQAGRKFADLTVAPADGRLLAVDEEAHELLELTCRGPVLEVIHRLPVSPYPVSVRVSADGSQCTVASLWSRRVTVVTLATGKEPEGKPKVAQAFDLPFAPRLQVPLPNSTKLLVADSFGGRLAVVDGKQGAIETVRTLTAHNLRGLALSADGKEVLLSHQVLNPLAHTTLDDVHWGNLITNNLRTLPLAEILDPKGDLLRGSHMRQLGDVGQGAGDPAGLAVGPDGTLVVALAGTDEIAVSAPSNKDWVRLRVGRRPTAVLLTSDGRRAFVANTLSDSVAVVDVPRQKIEAEISLGPAPELGSAERGELHFYNARLSHDGWLSCNSCHTDGHTNGLLNDNLGDNSYGAPKRILSLLGVKDTSPYAWNGGMPDLRTLIRKSVLTTLRGSEPTDEQVLDLEAFLRTLAPPPPLPGRADEVSLQRGQTVFEKQGCAGCHVRPTYTSRKTYNVGLTDEVGNTDFNPPSLRGVGQGGPYFHDNRAATLADVFTRHRHQLRSDLAEDELTDLLNYLRSL
jgi:YVTN family beta-propeller protein